jgi:hypothetical protein
MQVPELEQSLIAWQSNLPPALKEVDASLSPNGELNATFYRQSLVLRLRFLQARLILHRATVVHMLRSSNSSMQYNEILSNSFIRTSAWASVEACVESARETIYIIDRVDASPAVLGAWWYTLYYGE